MERIINIPEFLEEMLNKQYGEKITSEIIEGYKIKRPVTFRVNTLKTSIAEIENKLKENQIEFENVPWSKEAFIIKNSTEKEIENMQMYTNGEIYLQSLSSMLPPIILKPKQNYDILDMAAAPGGKTTQLAAITKNNAHITACEMNNVRLERLKYNINKQGATSVYIMQTDSRRIDDFFSFDQILLDAPCSRKWNTKYKRQKNRKNIYKKINRKSNYVSITTIKKSNKNIKTRT